MNFHDHQLRKKKANDYRIRVNGRNYIRQYVEHLHPLGFRRRRKKKQKLCQRLSRTYSEFLLGKESTVSDSKRKTSIHKVQIIIFLPSFVVIDEDKDA